MPTCVTPDEVTTPRQVFIKCESELIKLKAASGALYRIAETPLCGDDEMTSEGVFFLVNAIRALIFELDGKLRTFAGEVA